MVERKKETTVTTHTVISWILRTYKKRNVTKKKKKKIIKETKNVIQIDFPKKKKKTKDEKESKQKQISFSCIIRRTLLYLCICIVFSLFY